MQPSPVREEPLISAKYCCGFSLLFAFVVTAILYPIFSYNGHDPPMVVRCQSNLKQIGLGLEMYAEDYDLRLPAANAWMDTLKPYIKSEGVYRCPEVTKTTPSGYGYAFNSNLGDQSLNNIQDPKSKPTFYDAADLNRNAYAPGRSGIADPPRHPEGSVNNICFADGHVKAVGAKGR